MEKLKGIILSNGQTAEDYVNSLPEKHREVATESIIWCFENGYPLKNLEITRKGRELNRKKLGII